MNLHTERLELRLQTPHEVLKWVDSLSLDVQREISAEWLARLRSATTADPWSCTFTIIEKLSGVSVGSCGFKGPPLESGSVEIAYGIDERYRSLGYATESDPGDLKDYIEAATSIECVPPILPWSGGVPEVQRRLPQPERLLEAGEVLSVSWRTQGRRLKNRVAEPSEVQNPEFPFPGLYAVHASIDVITSERVVNLRSNEQLVQVGGSRAMPKYTFGHLLAVDESGTTAVLDLGSRHKVEPGDQFMHLSKQTPWKLTVTKVSRGHSWGQIELLSPNTARPPLPGMGATLTTKQ